MIKSITGYAFRVSMAQRNKEEGLTQARVRKGRGGAGRTVSGAKGLRMVS